MNKMSRAISAITKFDVIIGVIEWVSLLHTLNVAISLLHEMIRGSKCNLAMKNDLIDQFL